MCSVSCADVSGLAEETLLGWQLGVLSVQPAAVTAALKQLDGGASKTMEGASQVESSMEAQHE